MSISTLERSNTEMLSGVEGWGGGCAGEGVKVSETLRTEEKKKK